ncbi:uncharacterized protein LOC120425567 isoform X3 [Culex pipiens pallens]|uniref:uncharacterized protein LOC120425567 isoform X3 n=1 Tax=Culex pipiens pallens TaxID=42434 RepID=UPI0019537CAD|nr:uncharacterized protein LOC120425567 isoform X3 [Culex pipiens pallens]
MKCTSCVSAARPKSDDDEEASVSPAPTMDKPEQEYRVESPPPPPLPERASRIPSVSIVELHSDYRGVSPSHSGNSQLLRPLDVITEENSDVSDCENREPTPKPDLCFPKPKPRYKKPKSKNLLKNLLRQEPTTCVLVDAKIAETAPEEYRSVCTTEVVPEQILEVEVIDLGSNSSSLADLTDIDDLEPDKINNNDEPSPIDSAQPPPTSQPDDNDNDNESIAAEDAEQLSEEDNNGYDDATTQPPPPPSSTGACTQNDDDHHHDDQQCHEENERTESDRDDEEAAAERSTTSLAAGVDRVVTQRRNVNEVKERCTDDEDDDGSSDCSAAEVTHPAIGESLVTVEPSAMGEEEAPEVPPRPPPPPAMVSVPLVSAAERPTAAAAVTNLGQDEHEGVRHRSDAQIPAGSDTGEADPADADQNSEEDSGDAVAVESSLSSTSDSSVLLKLLQDPVEKRPTFGALPDQISAAATSENPQSSSLGAAESKIERAVKSEQLNYEIVQDHRVLREETVITSSSTSGSEVVLRRRGTGDRNESSPKEPSPEQKAALVHDLRNEISRIKDAELQEEFRKLELEAARIEQELGKMAVVPPPAENLTYYVSKQNDFAVERPPPPAALPRQKPPVVAAAPTPPPKPASTGTVAKSSSSNDLMYDEWQAKMEEREARRLHKVVKISKTEPSNPPIPLPPPPTQPDQEDPDLGDEFLRKVKERRRKFTIPGADSDGDSGASAPNSTPGTPIAGRKPVPRHIEQEFAEFAKIRKQQEEEEQKPATNYPQHQSRPRSNAPTANPPKAPPPQKISYPPPPVSVASAPPQNGTDSVDSGGESVKVSALVDVFQQKQREVLRQDSYKAAVKSVASSAENLAEPEPVSVSAKCQEFERKLQRSASSDGRKPLTAVKPNSVASSRATTNRNGVWSPHNRSTEILTKAELAERSRSNNPDPPPQPVWTPRSAPPSPVAERREFRPIGFESPTPQRRNQCPTPTTPAPWTTSAGYEKPVEFSAKPNVSQATTRPEPTSGAGELARGRAPPPLQNSNSLPTIGHTVRFAPQQQQQLQSRQQAVPSPTINSLLKNKDGKIGQQLSTFESASNQSNVYQKSTSQRTTTNQQTSYQRSSSGTRLGRASEISQPVGRQVDYLSEPESTVDHQQRSTPTMAQLSPRKVDGVGPMTREGMPLTLRSEVDENNQAKWYKKMYQTLHKAHDDDDFVTVRYKTRRGNFPYKSSGGYQSEPEPNYDSDYTIKYSTLDRRRTPTALNPNSYSRFNTLQGSAIKSGSTQYRNQPGRIENYTPGRSSVSEKESKEWWDEVMDIFNGQIEQQKLSNSKTYTEGNLSRALKQEHGGYDSDTTLIFRKKEPPSSSALSPIEQKQFYKNMQAGGEIPVQGFRKPAPEKPKDGGDADHDGDHVQIQEVLPTMSTNPFLVPPQEITCYPITSISRPLDMFGPFPREVKSFVPVAPPAPPNRKSSRSNSTLRIMSQIKTKNYDRKTVVESSSSNVGTSGTKTLRKVDQYRSKSAGPVFAATTSYVASSIKEEKNLENSTRVAKRYTYRASSSSPVRKASPSPVAFGRGISKERTFAEEKKRLEEKLPKVCRKDVTVSTSILRNPDLKSPLEVKKALRSTFLPMVIDKPDKFSAASRTLRRISSNFKSASSIYSSKQSLSKASTTSAPKKDDKALKVTVAISSRGKELVRASTTQKPQKTKGKLSPTITIKSNIQKVQKSLGLRAKTPSTQSLARTNSTFSIDSTNSKRKSRASFIPATFTSKKPSQVSARSKSETTRAIKKPKNSNTAALVESYNERIVQQNDLVRTDSFFQNLFLRKSSPIPPGSSGADPPAASTVIEKARLWNSLSAKSEPSLKQPNYYLTQAKPVSLSKFKTMDTESGACRSGSPVRVTIGAGEVIEQVQRYESLIQLTDEEEEFGGFMRGRTMKIDYSYHERSKSEPPVQTLIQEVIHHESPRTLLGRKSVEYSQTTKRSSRSPSCRRIQHLKGEGNVKNIVRARSLSTTDRNASQSGDELVRSHSLNLTSYERHVPICRHRRSDRFQDLNDFYSSLERLAQLEKATSSTDLRPRRRDEEIIDFDLWRKVRDHEKAEREMNQLLNKLKQDQREKDLLFLPHDPDEVRWKYDLDAGLRNKEKSVDDLKGVLSKKVLHFEEFTKRELDTRKDHYKPLWRGSSVMDVASQMLERYSEEGGKRDEFLSLEADKRYGISNNLLSTLSSDQMKKLKSQLSEIYSNKEEMKSKEEYVINVPDDKLRASSTLKVRSNSVLTKDQVNEAQFKPILEKGKVATIQKTFEQKNTQEALCQELKSKILEKHASHTLPCMKKKERPSIIPQKEEYYSLETDYRKLHGGHNVEEGREEVVMRKFRTLDRERPHSYGETESVSSETSNRTVIFRNSSDDVKSKIKYFEERRKEDLPAVTVYHARESSTDEDDAAKMAEERSVEVRTSQKTSPLPNSQSFTDFKDLFGEKPAITCSYTYQEGGGKASKNFTFRSRSSTPEYATCIQTGEVKKIKDKFESLDANLWKQSSGNNSPRQYQSDSELNRPFGEREIAKANRKIRVRQHEIGDVTRMTHKYEIQSTRARSRKRKERVHSPIPKNPLRRDDRFMPHINVISKTASLKQEMKRERPTSGGSGSGAEVEKIKTHQFPKPTDNARSITAPDQSPAGKKPGRRSGKLRASSTSPPRRYRKDSSKQAGTAGTAFLKQFYDIFADQKFDPSIHQPKYRYVPDRQLDAEYLWEKIQTMTSGTGGTTKASVTFEEFSNVPPPPPMKGTSLLPNSSSPYSKSSNEPESPRRYIESDVNIHYKTPIRYEYKEAIPDDELAYRQAEHMRRVYQEERRRKYMHELEDLQNRRHTDNFVPAQKSPIPVNRYEDFDADLAPKPNNVLPRTIARALYNFQGQTARELSFKKGDIIYLRRQIDKNWYEGEHNAMIGLLPANYIEILPRDGAKPLPKKPQREGKARAKFNFTAQTTVELSLLKGELVTLTRRVDDNWFEGRIGNKKGIFPVSYVEVLTDIGGEESYEIEPIVKPNLQTIQTHTLTTGYDNGLSNGRVSPGIIRETKTVQKTEVLHVDTTNEPISYRALYNYKPQNSDELELLEGDVVYVLEKCDDGWYVGTSARTGCFGTFPGNYVKKL